MIQTVTTSKAPPANGHYSHASVIGDTIISSVQLGIAPNEVPDPSKPISEQAQQTLQNLLAIVESAGGDRNTIAQVKIYVTDIRYWEDINEIYSQFFGTHEPARGVIGVKELHLGFKVAMECIAVKGKPS